MRRVAVPGGIGMLALAMFVLVQVAAAATPIVDNGGFETGSFTGWTVFDQAGGSGSWSVYSGTVSPQSSTPIPAPAQGTFAATTDQLDSGTHILYQDVTIPAASTDTLTFMLGYESPVSLFATPASLDFSGAANQQLRVDIMTTGAAVTSVAAGDVLASVFRSEVGAPATLAPTAMSFDLTPFAGQTLRIRFAEANNQAPLLAQVDDVAITSTPSATTTTSTSTNATTTPTTAAQSCPGSGSGSGSGTGCTTTTTASLVAGGSTSTIVLELPTTGEQSAIPLAVGAALLVLVLGAHRLRRRAKS